jgi:sulfate adenylyltransferase
VLFRSVADKPDAKPLTVRGGTVRFEDVHFGYNPERAILHGINLEVPAGRSVAIVGPSGSGKSTIANALMTKLMEMGGRPVTLLDGDIVRKNLSSELGFSKEHRDLNIRRIGFVASEITKNGGIAICAPIAPYAATRRAVREEIEQFGAFVEVHVATSLEECERRDRKGLYKLAREGKIKEFTGISDPYNVPENPELRVETENVEVDNCAHQVLLTLESMGLIAAN